jgi:hypothetical protein
MSSASDYMTGNAPQGASYQAPQIGMQLGQAIAGYPQAYMQGLENQRKRAVMDAFPDGIPPGTSVSDMVSTIAKAGGGQYVQSLLPYMITQQTVQSAGNALGGADLGLGGGPNVNAGPTTSSTAAGPANLTPHPANPPAQSAPPPSGVSAPAGSTGVDSGGGDTIRSLATEMSGGRDALPTIGTTARTLRLNPDAPLNPQQVASVRKFINNAVGNGQSAPPGRQDQQQQAPGNVPAPAPAPSASAPASQQSAVSPTAPTASREDASALGSEPQLRQRMDALNIQAGRLETYAGAIAAVNPATSTAALAKAKAFREQASQIFEYVSKGDQAQYEHQLRNQDLTNEEKNTGRGSSQIAAFNRDKQRQEILTKERGDIAKNYETKGTQAEQAIPMLQYQQKLVNSPGFSAGAGKEYMDALNNIGASFGLKTGASINQVFDKIRSSTVLDGIKAMAGTGPVRVAEMGIIEKASGDRSNQPGAIRAVLTMQQRAYQKELAIRDLIHKNGGVIDENAQAGIDQIMSKGLFSPKELQHPEMLQMPHFDSPQEAQASRLPRGTRYVGGGERVFAIQ